jgi:hypothetical protein
MILEEHAHSSTYVSDSALVTGFRGTNKTAKRTGNNLKIGGSFLQDNVLKIDNENRVFVILRN